MSVYLATDGDARAAADIAAFLQERAAVLLDESPLRQLALQSASHWRTIAGQQRRRHLAVVQLKEGD